MKKVSIGFAFVLLASMVAFPVYAGNTAQEEINKKNVLEFYEVYINQKNSEAVAKYVGSRYIQHNPMGADNLEGIRGFIQFMKEKMPDADL